jgi:tRNA uridine 5-carboxymethylaminomethyl modification enzyme
LGLVCEARWAHYERKQAQKARLVKWLSETRVNPTDFPGLGMSADDRPLLSVWLRRPEAKLASLKGCIEEILGGPAEQGLVETVETTVKYAGYLEQQERQISRLKESERRAVPDSISYGSIPGLSREVAEKLERVRPNTLGQAARIPGITPAAIAVLDIYLSKS